MRTFTVLCGVCLGHEHRSGVRARMVFVAISKLGWLQQSVQGDMSRQKGVRGEERLTK